jgi:DNA-binding NarL/FixJ family response regulator
LRNAKSRWTAAQERKLNQLVREGQSLRLIAHQLDRTEDAIKTRARKLELDISKLPEHS